MTEPSDTEKSPIPKPSSEPLQMEIDHPSAAQMPAISQYEQSRELRIKENLERMHKLGIVDLSLKLKSSAPSKQNRRKSYTPKASPPPFKLPPAGPVRRSSRLQNVTPATYSEIRMEKKNKFSEEEDMILENGSRPEIYSEEHEKLLGSTEQSWTLFVDGYGKDGKRIYDPVKGKTCHQCRQKTLGHRTHCSNCNLVQGQFCGDCLYIRYGEHVLEAQQNPDWMCPVCRGICNCSLCRQSKGWLPTGPLYKKIARMGFKSVAHFLIQTKRPQPNSGSNPTELASAKRSLSFTGFKVNPADKLLDTMEHHFENNAVDKSEDEKQSILQSVSTYETKDHISVKRSLSFSCLEQQQGSKPPNHPNHENDEMSQFQSANYELGEDAINDKEKELHCPKRKNGDNYSPSDECPVPEKKPTIAVESNTMDPGCSTGNDNSEKESSGVQAMASSTDQSLENGDNYSPSDECPVPEKKPTIAVESNTMDLGCSTGNDHNEKESSGVQAMASSTDQSLEKKTDISIQTSSEATTGEQSLEGRFFQETNGKISEEGANSLSKKKTTAQAKLSSSELKPVTLVSCSRVLRSRHITI